jgi:hypothetical protein
MSTTAARIRQGLITQHGVNEVEGAEHAGVTLGRSGDFQTLARSR